MQGRIQNLVKHLRDSPFAKVVIGSKPVEFFGKHSIFWQGSENASEMKQQMDRKMKKIYNFGFIFNFSFFI